MVPSQDDISQVEPPVTYSNEMVQCVMPLQLAICFLDPVPAANPVSTRAHAALQTIALALKQEFGVNVHAIVPRTVSPHLLKLLPTEAF